MIVFKNFDLTNHNAYRIKSICAQAYFPENENDLIDLYSLNLLKPKIILGNGNNIILSKDFYDEEFIIFKDCFEEIKIVGQEIIAEAGTTLLNLSEIAFKHSISGFEIFYDIPGSVGGAIVMNAGASGEEIKDLLLKVRYLDLADKKIKEIECNEIEFEYRNSLFLKNPNKIILKAWFKSTYGHQLEIRKKMETLKQARLAKQPRDFPNCGSVFKRPLGRYVGPMLDELGLKGFYIGGAMISEKHSGFIINRGNATGQDIITLIKEIQKQVYNKFQIELELEQRII